MANNVKSIQRSRPVESALTRDGLVTRARTLHAEIAQIFLDAEHWNSMHGAEESIDPDPVGELARIQAGLDRMLAAEDRRVERAPRVDVIDGGNHD